MGIELPAELTGVAAQAGVQWPQGDEDAMRDSAQAWRQAGTKLTALAQDADGSANHALSAVTGTAGTAARAHWQTFVAPDTGHLTATAKGCLDAADRLDAAADQVGAAKVRIVSHLVDLAQQTDLAHQAAAAGHPAALAALPTLVQRTAGNVVQVNHTLTNTIAHTTPAATPTHALLGNQTDLLGAHDPVAQLAPSGAPAAGLLGGHGSVDQVVQGVAGGQGPVLGHGGPVVGGHPVGGVGSVSPAGTTGPIQQPVLGDHTGPIAIGHGTPTPQMGVTVTESAAPVTLAPPSNLAPSNLAQTNLAPTGFGAPPPIAVVPHQTPQPLSPPASYAPTPNFGVPTPPPPAPPMQATPVSSTAPPQAAAAVVDTPRAAQPAARTPQPVPHRIASRRDEVALFLVYLFPIGQLPKASSRPSHQLPPPPPDTDFAAGLRFEPHDHPESRLVTADGPGCGPTEPGSTDVQRLTAGHDPLGGDSERAWDRRFLVRPATADHAAEYAWPPGELFPEGGCDAGEPVVLDPDTVIDRFGSAEGRVFAQDGTPFARRSLPPDLSTAGYHRYRVDRPVPVWRTLSAAWFGQPGGGVRYRSVYPAAELVAMGYLTELTGADDGS